MKKILLWCFVIMTVFACGGSKYEPASNALDAGREFIDGCLKGNFSKASFYMLPDATNQQQLAKLEQAYKSKGGKDKEQYKQASIMIGDIENLNDSVTIINYKNSYDKIARKLKIVRQPNDGWVVDFKYTFNGNL